MDWSNERYVRLYTRDTLTWKTWSWNTRSVFKAMLRKADRSGVIEVGAYGESGLAAVIECPYLEVVHEAIEQLTACGTVVYTGVAYVMPNFMAAQDATASDAHRQRESREKRRSHALGSPDVRSHEQLDLSQNVTETAVPVTKRDSSSVARDRSSRGSASRDQMSLQPSRPSVPAVLAVPDRTEEKITTGSEEGKRASRARPEAFVGWFAIRDAIVEGYEAVYRSKPSLSTCTKRVVETFEKLVSEHGIDEVLRRVRFAYETPPSWPKGPWAADTIAMHFDKLVPIARAPGAGRYEPDPFATEADYAPPEDWQSTQEDRRRAAAQLELDAPFEFEDEPR